MKTIGLCMIVKNESRVILRCLESVRGLTDYALIEDTGSTDGTQAIVRDWLDRNALPGEIYDAGWQDFASNRSHALQRLREREGVDYALMMDADDRLAIEPGFDAATFKSAMNVELYDVQIRHGNIRYARPQLCSNRLPFAYKGVLHEYLEGPKGGCSRAAAHGFRIETGREGARSSNPRKYEDDAAVLENALAGETDPFLISRYKFYLAQSYRDCGRSEKALQAYLERVELGFWDQEVFVSLCNAAKLQEALGRPFDEVIATYRRACDTVSNRAEALHGASRFCRLSARFAEGRDYARRGLEIALPAGGLFVEPEVYEWRLLDEFAVNAYWVAQYQECLDACERLLREGHLPQDSCERVKKNAAFAAEKIELRGLLARPSPAPRSATPTAPEEGPQRFPRPTKTIEQEQPGVPAQVYTKQFRIFRTIHIVWVGDERLCPDSCIDTWRRMNPDWAVRVWGNEELRSEEWRNIRHMRGMLTRELCGVADMMRWEILERYGGFAVDADSVCVRPVADWLFEPEIFACWENEIARPGLIANGYVYSHPGNRLIRQVVNDIHDLPNMDGALAWQLTGPQRLTDTFRGMAYPGLTVYPSHYFMPEHLSGVRYSGDGAVFAKQLWGRARPHIYGDLAREKAGETARQ